MSGAEKNSKIDDQLASPSPERLAALAELFGDGAVVLSAEETLGRHSGSLAGHSLFTPRYQGNRGICASDADVAAGAAQLVHACGDHEPAYLGVNGPTDAYGRLFPEDTMHELLAPPIRDAHLLIDVLVAQAYGPDSPEYKRRVSDHAAVAFDHSLEFSTRLRSVGPLISYFFYNEVVPLAQDLAIQRLGEIRQQRAGYLTITTEESTAWCEMLAGLAYYGKLDPNTLHAYVDSICAKGFRSSAEHARAASEQAYLQLLQVLGPNLATISDGLAQAAAVAASEVANAVVDIFGDEARSDHPDIAPLYVIDTNQLSLYA